MANTYCALYRKYRPENLDDVVGQNIIVKTLKNAIENNHISHAYLFTGPRGTGKTSIAKILAKTVNCNNLSGTTPCNICVSCTQINNKQNIDIIEIDAASNNGVDEIREIRNKVNLVPSVSKYKVYIIDEVHMLTTGAFNALLKTLEEPPSHIIFILATTEPHKIPNTILSRCQRFDFKRITSEEILKRLRYICTNEKIDIMEEALIEIANASDGGMRDAIGTLDQVISFAENNITVEDVHEINGTISNKELGNFVDLMFDKDLTALLNEIDKYYNNGKNVVKIIEEIVIFLKNILLFKTAPKYFENGRLDCQVFEKYRNINNSNIIEYITMFNLEINEIKKSNMPKFLFELLIIKLISIDDNSKVNNNNSVSKSDEVIEPKKMNNIEYNNSNVINIDNKENKPELSEKKNTQNKNKNSELSVLNNNVEFQQLRISNTLAQFNKQNTLQLRQELKRLNQLLMDPDVSQIVSIILDGELKASSTEYAIFVFETNNSTLLFNNNINNIEKVLEDFLSKNYKVIGVENDEWSKIKTDFNNKNRKFEYVKEDTTNLVVQQQKNQPTNEIEEIFGKSVEYEN